MPRDDKHLRFLEDFIAKHYLKQRPWVRTLVYVVFALLLAHAVYRFTAGEHGVRGRILQPAEGDSYRPADHVDVQVGDRLFGTSSRGSYYVVIGSFTFLRLQASGQLPLKLSQDGKIFPAQNVHFNRLEQEFEDIVLPQAVAQTQPISKTRASVDGPDSSILAHSFGLAWAGEGGSQAPAGDRLFLEAVRLAEPDSGIKTGRLTLRVAGKPVTGTVSPLLTARTESPASQDDVPLLAGRTLLFDPDLYFALPISDRPLKADITLAAAGVWFSRYSEDFNLTIGEGYGDTIEAPGTRGGALRLRLFSRYDVVLWEKRDLQHLQDQLTLGLSKAGFRVRTERSPLGYAAETNALFVGAEVPFGATQKLLRVITDAGIRLKTIQHRNLKSGNRYETQLGGDQAFDAAVPIDVARITGLLQATSEEAFRKALPR